MRATLLILVLTSGVRLFMDREQADEPESMGIQEQRELYESLPEPDTVKYPYPDLTELERTTAAEFYDT